MSGVTESEAGKTREERVKALLSSGRLVFLQTVGYSATEITGLGDLASLPPETVNTLLHRKAEEAIAETLGASLRKRHLRVRTLGGRKKK